MSEPKELDQSPMLGDSPGAVLSALSTLLDEIEHQAEQGPVRLPGGSVVLSREAWEAHNDVYLDACMERDMQAAYAEDLSKAQDPDALVRAIFATQNERWPDDDPGDITIEIQDDSDMVTLSQDFHGLGDAMTFGTSVMDVLRKKLHEVRGS
jgi:hypothetical protein